MLLPDPPALIYIAGGMTGYPDLNRPAFAYTEQWLLTRGWSTVNPSLGEPVDRQLEEQERGDSVAKQREGAVYKGGMRRNITTLSEAAEALVEGMVLLPGWERSSGARFDALIGQQIGLAMAEWVPAGYGSAEPSLCPPRFTVITMTRDNEPPGVSAFGRQPGHHCLRVAS